MKNRLPDFSFEKKYWKKRFTVGGADEVGKGAFAGPVVTSVVVFSGNETNLPPINDSKKLTAKKREEYCLWIKEMAAGWGVGQGSVSEINRFGINNATNMAFRRAVEACQIKLDYLLIDAFYIPYLSGIKKAKQQPIIKGDSLSISIAAASIVAKVHRDDLMVNYAQNKHNKYYFWHKNKGYGTKDHREAIEKYGTTRLHRTKYVETYLSKKG